MKKTVLSSAILASLLVTGCATTPEVAERADSLKSRYQTIASEYNAERYAPIALQQAQESISEVERLISENANPTDIEHQVYLAERRLELARETVELKMAEEFIAQAGGQRKDLLLEARTREAERARAAAAVMGARARSADSQRQSVTQRTNQLESEVQSMGERTEELEQSLQGLASQAEQLQTNLENVQAEETERGVVLTMDSVLFAFDSAELKPGAMLNLEQVAGLLQQHPDRQITIEGFTDSIGSAEYNEDLSQRRAESVKEALVSMGVEADRVTVRGYGEQYPIAPNDTVAGRLQNRRVAIVIGNQAEGGVAARE